jgi:MFS family permease
VFIGRFGCGFLSALPTVVGSGSIEDLWDVRQRIWAIDLWIKGSIVGIALGPTVGVYISTSTLGW